MFSPFCSHGFTLSVAVSTHLCFAIPAVKHSMGHTFDCTVTLFIPLVSPISELYLLRLLLTSYSSLLLQQMRPSVRPHGISLPVFPRLLAGSTYMVYGFLLNFAALSQLIHHVRLVSDFCPSYLKTCAAGRIIKKDRALYFYKVLSHFSFIISFTDKNQTDSTGFLQLPSLTAVPESGCRQSHRRRNPSGHTRGLSSQRLRYRR